MNRIDSTFENLHQRGQTALMPFLTMGYPARDSALSLVPALVEAGADMIELGVPFSDPLADGATIQAASQRALENGMTLQRCLDQVATLRQQGITVPFVLMGYYNPVLQFGLERLATAAAVAGVDGFIIPDLPPEEADLADFVARVRSLTGKPLAVGFGISTPEQAAGVATVADGVIVGSALVREIGHAGVPEAAAAAFVAGLRAGMEA